MKKILFFILFIVFSIKAQYPLKFGDISNPLWSDMKDTMDVRSKSIVSDTATVLRTERKDSVIIESTVTPQLKIINAGGDSISFSVSNKGSLTIKTSNTDGNDEAHIDIRPGGNAQVRKFCKDRIYAHVESSGGGLESAFRIQTTLDSNSTGNQWGGLFSTMYSQDGHSAIAEVDGYLSLFTHAYNYNIPVVKGYEGGGAQISNGSVTKFYAFDGNFPSVSGGGSVDTAACFHVPSRSISGITNYYAFLSENAAPSYHKGIYYVDNIIYARGMYLGYNGASSSYIDLYDGNSWDWRIANGVGGNGLFKIARLDVDSTVYSCNTSYAHVFNGSNMGINCDVGIGTETTDNDLNVNGNFNYWADTSSVDDSWGFTTNSITAYVVGLQIFVDISVANTDGATIQINALGAKSVHKMHNQNLETGDVEAGQIIHLIYDGTDFQMLSQLAQ